MVGFVCRYVRGLLCCYCLCPDHVGHHTDEGGVDRVKGTWGGRG